MRVSKWLYVYNKKVRLLLHNHLPAWRQVRLMNRILTVCGIDTRHSRKHNFYIRIVNAEQRAGILGMRQGRIEAPSEVD